MPDIASSSRTAFDHWCGDHLQERGTLYRSTRSGNEVASFSARDFQEADVLSVHFADGSVLHTSPQQWLAQVGAQAEPPVGTPRAANGAEPDVGNRVHLPFELPGPQALTTRATGAARGGALIDRYSLARLTEPTTLDNVFQVGAWLADGVDRWFGSKQAPAAGMLAGKLCRAFESSVLHDALGNQDGLLLRWDGQAWQPLPPLQALQALPGRAEGRPVVLFLHGTASSTQGSFGALCDGAQGGSVLPTDFTELATRCELLAWEHRSLTCSPLANALGLAQALAAALPRKTTLHLVSHSRGGMVGDLLCLGLQVEADQAIFHRLLADFYPEADNHPDQPLVSALCKALCTLAHLVPGTFVRVACPARGTLLADRRTDLFLSLLLRSVGLAFGGNGNPLYERLNGLVRGLVAARADARAIPGLEAMVPGSPLTLLLNAQAAPADYTAALPPLGGKLRVIAGDSAAAGLGGVFTLAGDVFYGLHDHDFVVHTHSMFGGFVRRDALSLRLEDKSVHHLGYFKPDALARGPLFAVLAGHDDAFRTLADDERITRGLLQALKLDPLCRHPRAVWDQALAEPGRAGQAIVVVLPGIMGSELFTAGTASTAGLPVWLSPAAMLAGRMAQLNPNLDNSLSAPSLMPVAYERLLAAAQQRYRVVPWPYDWRASVLETALRLRADLQALAAQYPGTPVHLLAHSMGGLVARAALFGPAAADPAAAPSAAPTADPTADPTAQALWADLKRRGSRLLMLGTPNLGSYAPVQLLVQQHALSHLLATMARKISPEDLARWGGQFSGLMQMLPRQADPVYGDLFEINTWHALRADDSLAQLPALETLRQARLFRAWRDQQFEALKDEPQALYVAGSGATPCALCKPGQTGFAVGEGGAMPVAAGVRFASTPEGDGVVPWSSRLRPERTWYADCEHGDLADNTDAFGAYFELLDVGRTKALPQTAPWRRNDSRTGSNPGTTNPDNRPDQADLPLATGLLALPPQLPSLPVDLGAYVLGLQRSTPRPAAALPIDVRIVHGGLDYARFPLIVGHYQNDGILGGTKRVDEKLDGQLSRMVDLKLFTGAERTSVYLRPPTDDGLPPAYPGAIVVGLGTVGELTPATLAATVTRAVLRHAFDHLHRDPWVAAEGPVQLRLSTLLIGTHVQAVTPRDSLAAVLAGIWRANLHLLRGGAGRPMQVAEVEVIEIQEQNALDAAYELQRLLQRDEWRDRLVWHDGTLESRSGRISGYRASQSDAVWQRLVVRQQALGGMRFELIAERARVEATQVQADVASLSSFIQQMSDSGALASGPGEGLALGQVLYQLLLPQGLKGRMLNLDNTVLVLDDAAAGYPWELMVPPEDDSSLGDGPTPLALQAGMVRQRVAYDFRALPTLTTACEALVVGAPTTDGWRNEAGQPLAFSRLPGALDEARGVCQWLAADQRPWRTTALLGDAAPFQRVRMALLAQPYRLLHLCGHGVVDFWVSNSGDAAQPQALRKTGMLLNNQQVLTAADIEQMGTVPEFVFINCCYSGRDGDETRLPAAQREYPLLAASLALQFIKMGSRAVVAAGWQVDDGDGLVFARTLYDALLQDNRNFGDAVLQARRAVRNRSQRGNTWGAYQCYGDPAWRFADQQTRRGYAQQYGSSRLVGAAGAMSRNELAERVLQVVALAGDKPRAALLMQLDELVATLQDDPVRRDWLQHSALRSAFGQAFRELGDHERAVQWLQSGTRNAYSRVALREVEFMINSLSRIGSERSHLVAGRILDQLDAIDHGDLLYMPLTAPLGLPAASTLLGSSPQFAQAVSGAKSERDCLRGSDRMHQARNAKTRRARATHFAHACQLFTTGYAGKLMPRDAPERRAYAMANAMLCAGLALLHGASLSTVNDHIDALRRVYGNDKGWEQHCAELLDEIDGLGISTSFWHYTNSLEMISARTLLRVAIGLSAAQVPDAGPELMAWRDGASSQLPQVLADIEKAQRLLRHALVRWPSPVEAESIRDRFEAMINACAAARSATPDFAPQLAALAEHARRAVALLRIDADSAR